MIFFIVDLSIVMGVLIFALIAVGMTFYDICLYISNHIFVISVVFMLLVFIVSIIGYFSKDTRYEKKQFIKKAIPGILTSPGIIMSILGVFYNIVSTFQQGVLIGIIAIIPSIFVGIFELALSIGTAILAMFGVINTFSGDMLDEDDDRSAFLIVIETLVAVAVEIWIYVENFT